MNSYNGVIDYRDFIDEEIEQLSRTEKGLPQKFNFMDYVTNVRINEGQGDKL